jgi:hypothetical protein
MRCVPRRGLSLPDHSCCPLCSSEGSHISGLGLRYQVQWVRCKGLTPTTPRVLSEPRTSAPPIPYALTEALHQTVLGAGHLTSPKSEPRDSHVWAPVRAMPPSLPQSPPSSISPTEHPQPPWDLNHPRPTPVTTPEYLRFPPLN